MTDFQVGDRVSVEGVVLNIDENYGVFVKVGGSGMSPGPSGVWVNRNVVDFVSRPRRKLRVGSVWECVSSQRYVHISNDVFSCWLSREFVGRDQLSIDTDPHLWREVPVEELERETQ